MIDGEHIRAASNKHRTIFSLSPRYFEIKDEEEQLKKVDPLQLQTAFASNVFPVPGGPKRSTPYIRSSSTIHYENDIRKLPSKVHGFL